MPHTQVSIARRRVGHRSREPVLSRWARNLCSFLCSPVVFRSWFDRVPFTIASILVLFYVVAPGNHDDNLYGTALQLVKYSFSMLFLVWFALAALTRQRINRSPLFPLAALVLSAAGVFSLTYSIAVEPGTTTYSSALIPLILLALPLVIQTRAARADGPAVAEYFFIILGLAAIFHVLWYLVNYASGLNEDDPGSYTGVAFAYWPVCFMILCGLFRRRLLLALSVGLVCLNMVFRISSTTGFIALFATALIMFYRPRYRPLFRIACVSIAGMIILGNLAALISKDVAEELYSIEPLMKEDALASKSNNGFRLGIINAVRDEMADRSILVGKFFSGDVTVDARKYYPDQSVEYAPIHSEYIIMFQQGGLIGLGLLTSVFLGMAFFWAKAARLAHAAADSASETLFDAVQAINLIFMLCIAGNPMLDDPKMTVPYLVLISLTVFVARGQPAFAGPKAPQGRPAIRGSSNVHRISEV